ILQRRPLFDSPARTPDHQAGNRETSQSFKDTVALEWLSTERWHSEDLELHSDGKVNATPTSSSRFDRHYLPNPQPTAHLLEIWKLASRHISPAADRESNRSRLASGSYSRGRCS